MLIEECRLAFIAEWNMPLTESQQPHDRKGGLGESLESLDKDLKIFGLDMVEASMVQVSVSAVRIILASRLGWRWTGEEVKSPWRTSVGWRSCVGWGRVMSAITSMR